MEYYIYKVENKINKKCYIGFTDNFERRKRDHIRFASYGFKGKFYNALRKYGDSLFKWDIIFISSDKEDTLTVMEQIFIDLYDSIECGYNQKKGGKGGSQKGRQLPPRTTQECFNISYRQIGRKFSKETKEKISSSHKGKKLKKETIEKMIKTRQKEGRLLDPDGALYYFNSIKDFCENHNLSKPDISKLLRNKINQYKGWRSVVY